MNVLGIAHPKTGQHYIIWFLGNYQRLINNREPMNWEKILEFSKFEPTSMRVLAPELTYLSETINFTRIEYPYRYNTKIDTFIESFDKTIYLYRNPYDTLISMFYYFQTELEVIKEINKLENLKGYKPFEVYVKEKIDVYINHIRKSIDHVDLVLYYDDLITDPSPFREILSYFYDSNLNEGIFQKALELSSFKHVSMLERKLKKEQRKKEQKDRNEFFIFHARNGRSGQYHELMSQELIDYISKKWEDLKTKVKYKLK